MYDKERYDVLNKMIKETNKKIIDLHRKKETLKRELKPIAYDRLRSVESEKRARAWERKRKSIIKQLPEIKHLVEEMFDELKTNLVLSDEAMIIFLMRLTDGDYQVFRLRGLGYSIKEIMRINAATKTSINNRIDNIKKTIKHPSIGRGLQTKGETT